MVVILMLFPGFEAHKRNPLLGNQTPGYLSK